MIIHGNEWFILPLIPLIFAELFGIGYGLFSKLFGGGKKNPIEGYNINPPPEVPLNYSDMVIGMGLIGLGVYLFIKGR
jgi:hypothetical protein